MISTPQKMNIIANGVVSRRDTASIPPIEIELSLNNLLNPNQMEYNPTPTQIRAPKNSR
uniref:hypothetical protein n=1 Tax=Enterobacteriaceae TaxID=543 RepID=UPI00155DBC0D|nr:MULTISPECIES: hypothetical protein [Enterobacteriaceae]